MRLFINDETNIQRVFMITEITAALKSIVLLVDAVKGIASQIENLSLAITEKNISKKINNPRFKDLEQLYGENYEVTTSKREIKLDLPLQIGCAVYQLAKLRMLEFYYDFIDKYIKDYYETLSYLSIIYDEDVQKICNITQTQINIIDTLFINKPSIEFKCANILKFMMNYIKNYEYYLTYDFYCRNLELFNIYFTKFSISYNILMGDEMYMYIANTLFDITDNICSDIVKQLKVHYKK
jgi:hypothetical protein